MINITIIFSTYSRLIETIVVFESETEYKTWDNRFRLIETIVVFEYDIYTVGGTDMLRLIETIVVFELHISCTILNCTAINRNNSCI